MHFILLEKSIIYKTAQTDMKSTILRYSYTTPFYTDKKSYLAKPSLLKPLPQINNIKILFRGNPSHYHYVRNHRNTFKSGQKIYLIFKEKVDLASQMMTKKTNQLTYITRKNYQSVRAISKDTQVPSLIEEMRCIKQFLSNFDFQITKSYLDLHPLEAYWKLCALVQRAPQKQYTKLFLQTSFSYTQMHNNTRILPFMSKLNKSFLNHDTQLKLKKLDRQRECSKQQATSILQQWRVTYIDNIAQKIYTNQKQVSYKNIVYDSLSAEQQYKNWQTCIQDGVGQFATIQDVVEGYGQNQFYAMWAKQN